MSHRKPFIVDRLSLIVKNEERETRNEKRGFTLIELLVVIAIIAILAAILFPVFARAKEKARTAACLSNVKQITLAGIQYAQDNDGQWPLGWYNWNWAPPSCPAVGWADVFAPYIKNDQLWVCPSDKQLAGIGYSNSWIAGYIAKARDEAKVTYPAEMLVLADGHGGDNPWGCSAPSTRSFVYPSDAAGWFPEYGPCCGPYGVGVTNVVPRHNNGANCGFMDGHAKWLSLGRLEDQSYPNKRIWYGIDNNAPPNYPQSGWVY